MGTKEEKAVRNGDNPVVGMAATINVTICDLCWMLL